MLSRLTDDHCRWVVSPCTREEAGWNSRLGRTALNRDRLHGVRRPVAATASVLDGSKAELIFRPRWAALCLVDPAAATAGTESRREADTGDSQEILSKVTTAGDWLSVPGYNRAGVGGIRVNITRVCLKDLYIVLGHFIPITYWNMFVSRTNYICLNCQSFSYREHIKSNHMKERGSQ